MFVVVQASPHFVHCCFGGIFPTSARRAHFPARSRMQWRTGKVEDSIQGVFLGAERAEGCYILKKPIMSCTCKMASW